MTMMTSINQFLSNNLVSDVMAFKRRKEGFKPLIHVHDNESIEAVLDLMRANNIRSVPVLSPTHVFMSILSCENILNWIVFQESFQEHLKKKTDPKSSTAAKMMAKEQVHPSTNQSEEGDWISSINNFVQTAKQEHALSLPVGVILKFLGSQGNEVILPSSSVHDLLTMFSTSKTGVTGIRRVFVTDSESLKCTSMSMLVSQSDLVGFIDYESKKPGGKDLRDLFSHNVKKIMQLHDKLSSSSTKEKPRPQMMTCPLNTECTLEVFRQMYYQNLTALPIVDDRGKLVGTISSSDLVGLSMFTLPLLLGPLVNFLENKNSDGEALGEMKVKGAVSTKRRFVCGVAGPDATVVMVIQKMMKGQCHRVWICDEKEIPMGVVSQGDVLDMLVPANAEKLQNVAGIRVPIREA